MQTMCLMKFAISNVDYRTSWRGYERVGWGLRDRNSFDVRGETWNFESAVAVEGSTIAAEAAEIVKKNKLNLCSGD